MEVIMKMKKPSEADANAALWDEVKAGYGVENATAHLRLDELREVTTEARKHNPTIPGLGKKVAEIPARDFFRILHKYGMQEVTSKEFIRYMHKKIPETKVASI